MQYLLLGFAALAVFLLVTRAYTMADPRLLARRLRIGAGVVLLAAAAVLVFRGLAGFAMSLAALGAWLIWGFGNNAWDGADLQTSSGDASRVTTEYLEVELEHATGHIRGRVLKGSFAGREFDSLAPAEIAQLWQDCRFADPQSAQILEAYLDRVHPTWREDMSRAEQPGAATGGGRMTRAQALQVLGLADGASEEDIRRAHRELMLKMHPDRGGSTYLAAQINEAKAVLLGK
jgi:hypothetical protein